MRIPEGWRTLALCGRLYFPDRGCPSNGKCRMSGKRGLSIDQELADAKSGLRARVTSKAAARFLGVHVDTLREWRKRQPPHCPPWVKGPAVGGGRNQQVFYDYTRLVEWVRDSFGRTAKEERLLAEIQRVRDRARECELEILLKREQGQLRRLSKGRAR